MGTKQTALVAGATGLVGTFLLQQLLQDNTIATIHCLTRGAKPVAHPSLVWHSYEDFASSISDIAIDNVYITLGTTIKKAGSRDAFEQVDRHLVRQVAEWGLAAGAKRLMMVSSIGADTGSMFFYSRVKGLVEQDVSRLGYEQVHIFRPAILDGPRTEKRMGEKLALRVFRTINPILVGPLRTYRSIHASVVAAAMNVAGKSNKSGVHIYPSADIADGKVATL